MKLHHMHPPFVIICPERVRRRVSNLLYDGEGDKGQYFILLKNFECSVNDKIYR